MKGLRSRGSHYHGGMEIQLTRTRRRGKEKRREKKMKKKKKIKKMKKKNKMNKTEEPKGK